MADAEKEVALIFLYFVILESLEMFLFIFSFICFQGFDKTEVKCSGVQTEDSEIKAFLNPSLIFWAWVNECFQAVLLWYDHLGLERLKGKN